MFEFTHKACNVDISNLCTLECPKCMRIDWKDKGDIPGKIMTVEQFAKIVKYFRQMDCQRKVVCIELIRMAKNCLKL